MIDLVERTLYWLTSFVSGGDVDAECHLRSPLNDDTIVLDNDDLMSVIEVRGVRRMQGAREFEESAANLAAKIAALFRGAGGKHHSLSVGFRSSPKSARRLIAEAFEPQRRTATRFGASSQDYFDTQGDRLAAMCSEQTCYLVLYTHTGALTPSERERVAEWREKSGAAYAKAAPGARLNDEGGQRPRVPPPTLIAKHASDLAAFQQGLQEEVEKGGADLLLEVLPVGRGLSLMRRHLDAQEFPTSWEPQLIGDEGALGSFTRRRAKASHATPMRLGRQLVSEDLREFFGDIEFVKRGTTCYAGVVLEVGPRSGSQSFSDLARRLGRDVPYTINLEIVPNGDQLRGLDRTYAAFMGGFGEHNRRVKAGWKHIRDLKKAGAYIAGYRATFVTWADGANGVKEITENLALLRSALESWDSCVVANTTGAPGAVALNAAAGFSRRMPAPYIPVWLEKLTRMLPLYGTASVWESGQLMAHTKEGRPYPVGFGTSMQAFWGYLVFAPSGMGKSFLMNMINEGVIFSPGAEELPYLTLVDVGPSGQLSMEAAAAALPPHLARQIVCVRVRNHPDYAVNPFDTQHGCDRPTAVDRDFQVSVVNTVVPGLGVEGERLIGLVIDQAFKMLGRDSPAQRSWSEVRDLEVDAAIEAIGLEVTPKLRVWQVVDALFDAGRLDDSARAQRYAVPRLADLMKAVNAPEVRNLYETALSTSGEPLVEVFKRGITTAISEFEIIAGFTRYELTNARVVAINLEEVVGGQSEEAKRRAAIMFLFARRLGARNYFLNWDEIKSMVPDRYRAHQEARIKQIESTLKFLEYDEVHYASGIEAMFKRISEDLRVGRKYKCVSGMSSQLLKDFPPEAVENCYSFFILGTGTDSSVDELRVTFGLSESEANAIRTECIGPGRLFARFKTKRGVTSQVLRTSVSPWTNWAFSTVKDDALLRGALKARLGVSGWENGEGYLRILRTLAEMFPSGSAQDAMDLYDRSKSDEAGEARIEHFARLVIERMKARSGVSPRDNALSR